MFCFPRWFLSFHYSSLCLPSFKSNLSRLCLRICGVFLVLYFNEFICTNESQICLCKTCFVFNHFVCIPIFLSKTVCSWRMGPGVMWIEARSWLHQVASLIFLVKPFNLLKNLSFSVKNMQMISIGTLWGLNKVIYIKVLDIGQTQGKHCKMWAIIIQDPTESEVQSLVLGIQKYSVCF